MKKIVFVTIAMVFIIVVAAYALGYHGQREFSGSNYFLPPPKTVVVNARILAGTPYDPLMGKYGNIGAKAGFIVCADVPNIAYGLSGFSLQKMLEDDYKRNPSNYNSADGNKPGNPYFHRRAGNLYTYFKANGRLFQPDAMPHVGDLVFYKSEPNGYISHVALVTEVREGNYSIMESSPETVLAQEVLGAAPIRRGFILVGFGRMYADTLN